MEDSPSQSRAKRQKLDKNGRFAALQKLRSLKGQKHKCDIGEEIDNVYDVVDESEFAKRAREKYGNDWIEDDGTGYLEDGRDFFEDEDEFCESSKNKSYKKKKEKDKNENQKSSKGSIRNLFSNVIPKKKNDSSIQLSQDDVLTDILGEINYSTNKNHTVDSVDVDKNADFKETVAKKPVNESLIVKEYMKNFMQNIKKVDETEQEKLEPSDEEIIEKMLKPLNKKKEKFPNVEGTKEVNKPSLDNIGLDIPIEDFFADEIELGLADEQNKRITSKQENVKFENGNDNLMNWETICRMDDFDEEKEKIPDIKEDYNTELLKMWYWDAWEDPIKRPGQVFLFGKIFGSTQNETKSVCVHIENVDRLLYLLPREYALDPITKQTTKQKVSFIDVYNEFNETISSEIGLSTFRTRKTTKSYTFTVKGVNVPESCEYMEVRYKGNKPAPNIQKKYNTIAHIFGTNTTSLETFLLERRIKGPCWLSISKFQINRTPFSWCKIEAICSSPHSISVANEQNKCPPPAVILAINVRTVLNDKQKTNDVVMISCLVNKKFCIDKPPPNPPFTYHFCGLTRPVVQNWPLDFNKHLQQFKSTKLTKHDTERALLSWFLATYQNLDPDFIVTCDANDCQLDVLCDRISLLKVPMWSRIGRLKMTQMKMKKYKDFFIGRMICDIKQSAEELIKSRSYDLDTLCKNILKIKEDERVEVSNNDIYTMFETSELLIKLIKLTMQDCSYILKIMCDLNVLPLALQITNICGNLMSRTLQGGRSERNEYLLLHAFNEKNFIVPDKKQRGVSWDQSESATQMTQSSKTRKKAAYSGGLVLDPLKGFYDKFILLMDFNSLYPSIIQEYNICFTTVTEPIDENEIARLPESNVEQGVLPRQIRRLVESRREVKKLMVNPDLETDQKMQYNIRQLALKLTANSMYGCLGFSQSRFFAQHLAALVTHKGREILMNTRSLVQKMNYEVVYGDTDSIMVNTNSTDYDQVFKIGNNIKQSVNKIYKQIELEIDGVFKYLLLLKKKKYAAVVISKNKFGEIVLTQEYKGLDIVRRDWSELAIMAGKLVLNEILSEKQLDDKIDNIHLHLEKFKQNINDDTTPLPLYTITKQLTKAPKDYTNITTYPHVQVALRMNTTKNRRYKKGDMISYIIAEDGTNNPPMQRAYHIDEFKSNTQLKIDKIYYLAQQIHPVVSRLSEPLEGTDASRIAGYLGLDASKFKVIEQKTQKEILEDEGSSVAKSNFAKYRLCEKFQFTCLACKSENIVATAFKPAENKTRVGVLEECRNKQCKIPPYQYIFGIRNELILSIRKYIKRFYENWLVCDDPSCNNNTRTFSHVIINNRPVCLMCKQGLLIRQYTERDLFNQISYFQFMFDISSDQNKIIKVSSEAESAYNLLRDTVNRFLENSAYCTISLSKLFSRLGHQTMVTEIFDSKIES